MADDNTPLTEDERAELERLRAEKAERAANAERAELERLRVESERAEAKEAEERHIEEVRERNRKIMEPDDDDLSMPLAQKLVLAVAVVFLVAFVVYYMTHH